MRSRGLGQHRTLHQCTSMPLCLSVLGGSPVIPWSSRQSGQLLGDSSESDAAGIDVRLVKSPLQSRRFAGVPCDQAPAAVAPRVARKRHMTPIWSSVTAKDALVPPTPALRGAVPVEVVAGVARAYPASIVEHTGDLMGHCVKSPLGQPGEIASGDAGDPAEIAHFVVLGGSVVGHWRSSVRRPELRCWMQVALWRVLLARAALRDGICLHL